MVLELELKLARQAFLSFEPSSQPFFVMVSFKIGSFELFAGLTLSLDPPDLCLLRS
jgi:hypothetical protein